MRQKKYIDEAENAECELRNDFSVQHSLFRNPHFAFRAFCLTPSLHWLIDSSMPMDRTSPGFY
jgi:hypothetical protein